MNKDSIKYKNYQKEYHKTYNTSDKYKNYQKKWRKSENGKACFKAAKKRYRSSKKGKETERTYRKSAKAKAIQKRYVKIQMQTNIQFRLRRNLRIRLCHILKDRQKIVSSIKDLGCSVDQLKLYLESQFQLGMTWNNYGNKKGQWSIDHIIPLANVDLTNREELLKACHYTNLQPLWAIDNLKKSNKIDFSINTV